MARRRETHPALVVTGLAMVLPALIAPASPSPGGLLPLALAVVLSAGLFAPLALAEWTRPRDVPDDTLDVAVRATSDVWVTLLVGAAAAACMPASPTGIGIAALAWLGAAALLGVVGPVAAPVLAAAAVLAALPAAASVL